MAEGASTSCVCRRSVVTAQAARPAPYLTALPVHFHSPDTDRWSIVFGAGNGARTRAPELGRLALYPLSYSRSVLISLPILGGEGRIRTSEGVRRQIYSLLPLAAREPLPMHPL